MDKPPPNPPEETPLHKPSEEPGFTQCDLPSLLTKPALNGVFILYRWDGPKEIVTQVINSHDLGGDLLSPTQHPTHASYLLFPEISDDLTALQSQLAERAQLEAKLFTKYQPIHRPWKHGLGGPTET